MTTQSRVPGKHGSAAQLLYRHVLVTVRQDLKDDLMSINGIFKVYGVPLLEHTLEPKLISSKRSN